MKRPQPVVKSPSRFEQLTLQLMILIGLLTMGYFIYNLTQKDYIGYKPFYWLLIGAIIFQCLKVLHEWYHYFSITIPEKPATFQNLSVDIITTYCPGEPFEMIEETLRAIQSIPYPHTTYLGDEGNDPEIRRLCKSLGVNHVTRTDRTDAKAGNVNNVLRQCKGDLCVVLDPDHVPVPEFLDRIVPFFSNPEIGYVQVVQAYKNLDENLVAKGAAQQTFQFYGPMMMSMNRYGTVMAIGANCTFRRAALDSIGGHAAGLAEDMHTAMQLHAAGWKSVYVPEVLTRGLVPSTLSAYYKQQLKWARGTFELLVTVYPKLFRRFTWRQRFHYGLLPFHYFSGVIFLINFLIPILSLVTGVIPLRIDLLTFGIVTLPFAISAGLIRHYVQRWVMEEEERGFHMVGGILLIGTWWIYLLGLVYTLVRKKVPYIPTPKDSLTRDDWRINIPNMIVAFLSATAIVYGLLHDWNPYAIFMAFVTSLNILFMLFMLYASQQLTVVHHESSFRKHVSRFSRAGKRLFWLFRHWLYSVLRVLALPVLLSTLALTFYFIRTVEQPPAPVATRNGENKIYSGIFMPASANGVSDLQSIDAFERSSGNSFNLISWYVAWGVDHKAYPADALVRAICEKGKIPFITWEPWLDAFPYRNPQVSSMRDICNGHYDDYIKTFAGKLRDYDCPIFLRFAHEFDNPSYPWFDNAPGSENHFKQAWRHVHAIFDSVGATNVIWVWSPWRADHAEDFFPGERYVDWLSVTALDYALTPSGSFKDLYAPFHALPLFQTGLPVMLSETGTLRGNQRTQWFHDALRDRNLYYPEIKGCILFNNRFDQNVPSSMHELTLDWSLADTAQLHLSSVNLPPDVSLSSKSQNTVAGRKKKSLAFVDTVRGVNFSKGKNWFKNFHALTRPELATDVQNMKALGVNVIKRYGPGIYDRNVFAVLRETKIKWHLNFWIDDQINVLTQADELAELENEILTTVTTYKDDEVIFAWNLDNHLWHRLKERYQKPALFYHQEKYLHWLSQLVRQIKAIDPIHPVTIDLRMSTHLRGEIDRIYARVPVDAIGVTLAGDDYPVELDSLAAPMFFSYVTVPAYLRNQNRMKGAFISEWQDLHERNIVTTDGLYDHWGRAKNNYTLLRKRWNGDEGSLDSNPIKILRPAVPTIPGTVLTYHILEKHNDKWTLGQPSSGTKYEWYLLRTDDYGNNILMKKAGEGRGLDLIIPDDPLKYRLYVIEVQPDQVRTASSTLNTPLGFYSKGEKRQ